MGSRSRRTGKDMPKSVHTAAPPGAAALVPGVHDVGPITVMRMHFDPAASAAPGAVGGPGDPAYMLLLLLGGRMHVGHYGHDSEIGPGDFVLLNGAVTFSLQSREAGEGVLLQVAPRVLRTYLPSPEHFCGLPLRGGDAIADGAAELAAGLCDRLEQGLPVEYRSRVARTLLDMLATGFSIAFDGQLDGSPLICSRNARVRLHIEENLRDPELKPATIASQLKLSPRYLRQIFTASRETLSAYILRRRLEECARELGDPARRDRSITDIAFGWGFNSAPHFTRSFRARFGVSPRDYRRMTLEMQGDRPMLPS